MLLLNNQEDAHAIEKNTGMDSPPVIMKALFVVISINGWRGLNILHLFAIQLILPICIFSLCYTDMHISCNLWDFRVYLHHQRFV